MIEQIHIINFMGIKNKKYQLTEITNFFGNNAQGKTTVFKALMVAFFGPGKKSKELINNEETRACIRVWVRMHGDNDLLLLERNISLETGQSCSLVYADTGQPVKRMADVIREHFKPEMFSPEDILGEKSEQKILNLVNVPICKEDIIGIPVNVSDFDFSMPGLKVLSLIEKMMKKHREGLFQELKRSKGWMETKEKDCAERVENFNEEYQFSPDKVAPHSEIMEQRIAEEVALKNIQDNFDLLLSEYGICVASADRAKDDYEKTKNSLQLLNEEMNLLKVKIESAKEKENIFLKIFNQKLAEKNQAIKPEPASQHKILEKISELKTQENISLIVLSIKSQVKEYQKSVSLYESDKTAYDDYRGAVFDIFKKLKKKKMAQVSAKVPGLKSNDEGQLYWHDLPVEGLSTSERMELGMRLQILNSKPGSLIFFDRAESLDSNTIKRLEICAKEKEIQLILTSVSDSPMGGDWLNHQIEKEK